MKDKELTPEDIWNKLKDADEKNFIICCSIDSKDPAENQRFKDLGLVCEHAYTMIGCADLDGLRLCRIRNPWGNFEWKGDWGDNSDLWTDDIKSQVKYTNANDGGFWMSWDDVQTYFSRFSINRYRDDCQLVSRAVHQEQDGFTFLRVNLSTPGTHVFSVC